MAAIAGWMGLARNVPDDEVVLDMLKALAHRGPGEPRACVMPAGERRVVLGHGRLPGGEAPSARQPILDEAAGLAVALDGDIDNRLELRAQLGQLGHRLPSGCDAELLLCAYRQWDKELLRHVQGGFAFALWDAGRQQLMLARDRFGERPLYVCEGGGSVFFASEVKALLKVPGVRAEVDMHAVREYLAYSYAPGPRTLFKGIRKLMPASYALWQLGRRREVRYWSPPDRDPRESNGGGAADAVRGFLTGLESAVKRRIAPEAPAGAFLSGGLDSSAIVALMARHCRAVRTFSVGFSEDHGSELAHAARVARHFGTEHQELVISRADLVGQLARIVACRDAPVSEPADVPLYLLAREAAHSVTRVLTGEGGDELLGGYRRHVRERIGWPLVSGDWRRRLLRASGALDGTDCDRLAGPKLNGAPILEAKPPFDAALGNSGLRRALYFDQIRTLADHLLERHDRVTMAASIEARGVFVDAPLAEYVSALPDALRVRGLRGKWILRQAGRQLLPWRLRRRSRPGVRVPLDGWLGADAPTLLLDHLQSRDSLTRAYYHAPALDCMVQEHLKGRRNHQKLLWTLLSLEIWHRTYRPG